MATSANPKSSTLAEDVDKELTCAICLSRFETPKVLPCLHTYCKHCLEDLLKKSRKHDQITCPQCNGEFPLPEGGIEGFKTHFTVNNLLELLQVHEASENKTSAHIIQCESEDENPAVSRCIECCCYLCESCHAYHKKLKSTRNHQVLSLDEIKRSDKKTGAKSLQKEQYCEEHKEKLRMFCKSCKKVICFYCALVQHREHEYCLVQDVRPEIQQQLQDLLQQVQAKETEFLSHKQYAENVHSINGSTLTACEKAVNQRFSILAETLEARRAALVAELHDTHEAEEKQLNAEVESLKLTLIKLSSSIRFCRQLLDNGSDVEVVSLSEEATQSLSGLKETKWNRHAVKPTLLRAVLDPELEKNIKGFGEVVHTIRPEDIVIQMPHTSYTNEEVTIKVQLSPEISEGGYSVPPDTVHVDIKHEDNTPVPCALQSDSLNVWTVSCTPKKTGAYKISVRVANVFTKENPMTLKVTALDLCPEPELLPQRRHFVVSDLLKEQFDNEDFGGPSDPSDASKLVFTHGGKDFFFTPMITTTDDHTAAVVSPMPQDNLSPSAKEMTAYLPAEEPYTELPFSAVKPASTSTFASCKKAMPQQDLPTYPASTRTFGSCKKAMPQQDLPTYPASTSTFASYTKAMPQDLPTHPSTFGSCKKAMPQQDLPTYPASTRTSASSPRVFLQPFWPVSSAVQPVSKSPGKPFIKKVRAIPWRLNLPRDEEDS